jgi:hypothetical protein
MHFLFNTDKLKDMSHSRNSSSSSSSSRSSISNFVAIANHQEVKLNAAARQARFKVGARVIGTAFSCKGMLGVVVGGIKGSNITIKWDDLDKIEIRNVSNVDVAPSKEDELMSDQDNEEASVDSDSDSSERSDDEEQMRKKKKGKSASGDDVEDEEDPDNDDKDQGEDVEDEEENEADNEVDQAARKTQQKLYNKCYTSSTASL